MVAQLGELTKNHWNVHLKGVNVVICKLNLNNYYQNNKQKTGCCDHSRKPRWWLELKWAWWGWKVETWFKWVLPLMVWRDAWKNWHFDPRGFEKGTMALCHPGIGYWLCWKAEISWFGREVTQKAMPLDWAIPLCWWQCTEFLYTNFLTLKGRLWELGQYFGVNSKKILRTSVAQCLRG